MSGIDAMGIENATQGICGFTSTMYAIYANRPELRAGLQRAFDDKTRSTRLMAEIKSLLVTMNAEGKQGVLDQIMELTRTFPNFGGWTVDSYIASINSQTAANYSIAMPPEATMEYMRSAWKMRPSLVDMLRPGGGDAVFGLTRTGAPRNRWKNLAHYVYRAGDGTLLSWGEKFNDLNDLNTRKNRDYAVVYIIKV